MWSLQDQLLHDVAVIVTHPLVEEAGISRVCAHILWLCVSCGHAFYQHPARRMSPAGRCLWVWHTAYTRRNLFHDKSLGVGGLLQGSAWSCVSQVSYDGLTIFSFRVSIAYPSTYICVSWYGRQLITIISDLVPSKKEISGIGASSVIGGASSSNCRPVCLSSVSACSLSFEKWFPPLKGAIWLT